jgi:carboxymethylenebutenolidase
VAACRLGDKLSCGVGYYGGGIVSYLTETPAIPLTLHFGALDASIPTVEIERIRAAHPDVRVHIHEDADHGFNCDHRRQFNADAARLAEQRTLEFFATHLR